VVGVSGSLFRHGAAELKADAAFVEEAHAAEAYARREEAAARRQAEDAQPTVMVPRNARAVRVRRLGWHEVVRVNAATVTVVAFRNEATGFEATARIPLADVTAVAL
jgi:hypothetical protein